MLEKDPQSAGGVGREEGSCEWVSQAEAAQIVGCRVSTIDWHSRQPGTLLHSRPRFGRQPTLDRESVVAFAAWWKQRERDRHTVRAARQQRAEQLAARRPEAAARGAGASGISAGAPPSLTTEEAGQQLGIKRGMVINLIRSGELGAQFASGRWWVDEASVDALSAARGNWVTKAEAAQILDCTVTRIERAVRDGVIARRDVRGPLPTLRRADLASLQVELVAEQAEERRRRVAAAALEATRQPPDGDQVWLTLQQAAGLLGHSREWVRRLAAEERISATRVGRRWWFRENYVVQRVGAERFARRRAEGHGRRRLH